ncbi:MAG TPA: HPF/RaiA family ribosome-associated protein [Pirellulales bacterium]|nr:HPF/RaiA family ribosome-associated protein [Pirellulales bacterium]
MKLPVQISFHNLPHSDEIEDIVYENAARLDSFCEQIMSCRVVVDVPHLHRRQGNLYQVRIDITVPGEEIAVNREAGQHTAYKDLRVAIDDAFNTAARLLEDYARRHRQDVKTLRGQAHARVAKIFPEAGYGFLKTLEGREVYFHRNSLLGSEFDQLEPGTEVMYAEEQGEKGPQASSVKVVGRHHHV